MKRKVFLIFSLIPLIAVLLFTTGCKDDDYYKKPSWVGDPIYQYLEKQGGFTSYLTCVDKTEYASLLKGTGYYTAFIPDDDAFKVFMSENNIQSIDEISTEMANKIVSYSLMTVASMYDEIDNYQRSTSYDDRDKNLNIAFKRATMYSKGVYDYVTSSGDSIAVIDDFWC